MAENNGAEGFTLTDLSSHIKSQEAFLRHIATVSETARIETDRCDQSERSDDSTR